MPGAPLPSVANSGVRVNPEDQTPPAVPTPGDPGADRAQDRGGLEICCRARAVRDCSSAQPGAESRTKIRRFCHFNKRCCTMASTPLSPQAVCHLYDRGVARTCGGVNRCRSPWHNSQASFGKLIGFAGETAWPASHAQGTAPFYAGVYFQSSRFEGARYAAAEPIAESRGCKRHLPEADDPARSLRCSLSTLDRSVRRCIRAGVLVVESGKSRRKSNSYFVTWPLHHPMYPATGNGKREYRSDIGKRARIRRRECADPGQIFLKKVATCFMLVAAKLLRHHRRTH